MLGASLASVIAVSFASTLCRGVIARGPNGPPWFRGTQQPRLAPINSALVTGGRYERRRQEDRAPDDPLRDLRAHRRRRQERRGGHRELGDTDGVRAAADSGRR